ncbi:polysaccharide biosynthesis/export family protein [Bacteroidales bacterium OttesenSCG-928-L03]|nr:polysaccharide biosynthesis/export family protein [Bacteroidales bacterium OttesenSCG-928-L03]
MNTTKVLPVFWTILIVVLLSSCGSTQDLTYFQNTDSFARFAHQNDSAHYEIRIQPNDNLLITVTSTLNPQAVEPFNTISFERTTTTSTLDWRGYLVDEHGYINFPGIGKLFVANMTKDQLIALLEKEMKTFVQDAIVNIRFLNYSISVMGEVAKPGLYTVTDEKITVPQALALAGDLTIYGRRDNVLICRVENGQKQFYTLDLRDPRVFNSPYYYLQQNDIVYVAPNKAQAGRSVYNQTWSTVISVTSLLFTLAGLIVTISKK